MCLSGAGGGGYVPSITAYLACEVGVYLVVVEEGVMMGRVTERTSN